MDIYFKYIYMNNINESKISLMCKEKKKKNYYSYTVCQKKKLAQFSKEKYICLTILTSFCTIFSSVKLIS